MTSHFQHFYLLYQSLHCPGPAVLQPWVQCVLSTDIRKGLLLSAVLLTTNKTLVTKVTRVLLLCCVGFFFCSQRKQYSPSPFGGALAPQMKQGSILLNPEDGSLSTDFVASTGNKNKQVPWGEVLQGMAAFVQCLWRQHLLGQAVLSQPSSRPCCNISGNGHPALGNSF